MPGYPLNRFKDVFALSSEETQMLRSLSDPPVHYRRYTTIRREGDAVRGIYILMQGWASASILLPSGLRQIVKLQLSGDLLGTPSMVLAKAAETLLALTDCIVAFIPMARLHSVFSESPRLTAFLFASAQMERVALMDLVALLGRASARERYATLLVDVHERLLSAGVGEADRFELPLTQEQIGDVLGLTMVHTNRTVRSLEREGLIARQGSMLILRDPAAIRRLSPLPKRQPSFELEWAPGA